MIKNIANIGVSADLNALDKRIHQIINILSIFLGIITLVLASYNVALRNLESVAILTVLSGMFFMNLYYDKKGKFTISKIVLSFAGTLVPFAQYAVSGNISDALFVSMLPVTIVSLLAAMLVFDRQRNPVLYYFSIFYYVLYAAFFDSFCFLITSPKPYINFLKENHLYYKVPLILSVFVIAFVFTFVKNVIYAYERAVEKAKKILETKNNELRLVNSSLEEKIAVRTRELSDSKKKIVNLAFITAHEIRGPLSSIMGFTAFLRQKPKDEALTSVLPQLYDKSVAMDSVIKKMVKSLEVEIKKGA